jgi:DNA-binding MarR family transcriptional regulator
LLPSHLLFLQRQRIEQTLRAQQRLCEAVAVAETPSQAHVHAWRLLLESQALVVERVEAALAEHGLPPLAWYDVLWALREAPGRRLRQSRLADAVVMSRSGLSRLVDRIEAAGLLRREAAPSDRRGTEVLLTPEGAAMLRRMWAVYGDGIARGFAAALPEPEALADALAPVVAALRAEPQPIR